MKKQKTYEKEDKSKKQLTWVRKNSRRSSVRPPRPHDVKKLMANLVLRGLSLGKRPSKAAANVGSRSLSFNLARLMNSASS